LLLATLALLVWPTWAAGAWSGLKQRAGADHQDTQAGNQAFRHFHRVLPQVLNSKKGNRTWARFPLVLPVSP
jgi:hypothetical protein